MSRAEKIEIQKELLRGQLKQALTNLKRSIEEAKRLRGGLKKVRNEAA
jgi:hypothetical protein